MCWFWDRSLVKAMAEPDPAVSVVDNDPALRESVGRLLDVSGFLEFERANGATCLVRDGGMLRLSGPNLQRALAAADVQIPIAFITGHGDIPTSVPAIKRGAIELVSRPRRAVCGDTKDAAQAARRRSRSRGVKIANCAPSAKQKEI